MKNILDSENQSVIISRINSLSKSSYALWGKMNVYQMICHCTDQIRLATGEIEIIFLGNFFLTKILKNLILLGVPAPKGKVKTYKELDQLIGGTKPSDFESDKETLIDRIKEFDKDYPKNKKVIHPSFGKMDKNQWGRLIYFHLNHHLRQLGA